MLPYFFLLFVSAALPMLLFQPLSRVPVADRAYVVQKKSQMTVFLFFAGFFILLALRDFSVGRDLFSYKNIFEISINTPFSDLSGSRWELGYLIYNKLFSFITRNYRFLLIFTAFITILPIYKLYSKEKRYGFLLIVLFINMPCFLMIFSGLRQSIATSIGILVYMCLEKKKYLMSALLIILAGSFHISALILVFIFPAYFLKIKSKHLLYLAPMMFAVYLFRVPLLKLIIRILPGHFVESYGQIQHTGAIGMMLLFLIFFVFSFVILDEEEMSDKDFFMRNILLIATVFQFFVPIHGLIQRASYYFIIFVPVSILCVVQAPKRKLRNISDLAVLVMTCFFTLYFFYNASFSTDNLLDVFPYKFFWSGQGW